MTVPTCPNCGAPMTGEAGFGMVICNSCGDLVMMGGEPAQPSEVSPQSPEPMMPEPMTLSPLDPQPESMAQADFAPSTPVESPETFKDVVEFGNQELPSQGAGVLVYNVDIEGIDTPELRRDLIDVLSDSRLGLEAKSLSETIDKGVLHIPELNPVKAAVILTRLRSLDFKIKWTSKQLVKAALVIFILVGFQNRAWSDDWSKHEANLNNYAGRINSTQEEIHDLIVRKNQNKDPSKRDALLEEIKKKNESLQTLYKSYKDEKDQILYEHPEQGDNSERKYRHVKMKTLEEMESEPGVDGQLSRIKAKVEQTYPDKKSN